MVNFGDFERGYLNVVSWEAPPDENLAVKFVNALLESRPKSYSETAYGTREWLCGELAATLKLTNKE